MVWLWHRIQRGHQRSLCPLPHHRKSHLSEPSVRGRKVQKGKADMKEAGRKDERGEWRDSQLHRPPRGMAHSSNHQVHEINRAQDIF